MYLFYHRNSIVKWLKTRFSLFTLFGFDVFYSKVSMIFPLRPLSNFQVWTVLLLLLFFFVIISNEQ